MVFHGTPRRASEVTGSRFMLRGAGGLGAKGLAGLTLRPMDVVVWPRGELVRCLREDMATDSLVEAWVTIYWPTWAGTPWAPPPCMPRQQTRT